MTITFEARFIWSSVKKQNPYKPNIKRANIGTYVDELIAIIPAEGISNVLYAHQDRQYNLRGLTDSTGTLVEYYAYSPYGERTAYASNGTEIDQTSVELKTEYGFTGRRYDMESDLWYFRARYFDTEMGRFVSRDPLGYVDGYGLYNGYFASYFLLDPYGLDVRLETGNNRKDSGGSVNNALHQNITVDHYDRNGKKDGTRSFSFGKEEGLTIQGSPYSADRAKKRTVEREKETTREQDMKLIRKLQYEMMNSHEFRKLYGPNTCRTYSQEKFDEAPGREKEKVCVKWVTVYNPWDYRRQGPSSRQCVKWAFK